MNPPPRTVTLRLRDDAAAAQTPTLRADADPDEVERMLQQAEALGLPRHADAATAALLAAVRVRPDVPQGLYAALAAVLSRVNAAAERLR